MGAKKRPDVEGWWWHRHSDQHVPTCMEVFQHRGYWWASSLRSHVDEWHSIENLDGEWVGPIAMPIGWEI